MGTELFTESVIPEDGSSARTATERHYEQNSGKTRKQRGYKRENTRRRESRTVEYIERDFVAWDGEGLNEPDGSHTYVLLANSVGGMLLDRDGLSTTEVFDLFLSYAGDQRIHVVYGGNYDWNMVLKDMGKEALTTLYTEGLVWWRRYRVEWRGGKSFSLFRQGKRFMMYDVLPFFQRSFVSACDEYLGADWPNRDEIVREKKNRGNFSWESISTVTEYNQSELETLVRLCQELRSRLNRVGIRVNRWDGPGAIASALYRQYGVKSSLGTSPKPVSECARFGYAGGRFEIVRKGHSPFRAYQYDIRSAYPSAMRELPCLSHGEWRHVVNPTSIVGFGIYRIEVKGAQVHSTRPQPLWHRNKDGTVYFSDNPHGWYWSPEAAIGIGLDNAICHEGWEYSTPCQCEPFSFVEPLYLKRAALKRAGDGAHVGLKLGLNSLYGKLAQQIGWEIGPPLRLPPFHCLEWAGFVTSHCRAQVYRAAMLAPDDVIAFETDAVFTRVPLPLQLGEGLGEWDETVYSDLTYLKSGMYWGTLIDGTQVEKTRGINKGSIPRDLAIAELNGGQSKLPAEQTRFITLGQALHQDFTLWTHWITSPRFISVALWGKRIDVYDSRDNYARRMDGWEETIGGPHETTFSYPYEIEWVALTEIANDAGIDLGDLRRMESHGDYEYE